MKFKLIALSDNTKDAEFRVFLDLLDSKADADGKIKINKSDVKDDILAFAAEDIMEKRYTVIDEFDIPMYDMDKERLLRDLAAYMATNGQYNGIYVCDDYKDFKLVAQFKGMGGPENKALKLADLATLFSSHFRAHKIMPFIGGLMGALKSFAEASDGEEVSKEELAKAEPTVQN